MIIPRKLLRNVLITLFFSLALFVIKIPRISIVSQVEANIECEFNNPTNCNPNGNTTTGHLCQTPQNIDLGYYACNLSNGTGYWGSCAGLVNGVTAGMCIATIAGSNPPTSQSHILYKTNIASCGGDRAKCNACAGQAWDRNIAQSADLYCVCGVPGAAACPLPTTPTPTPTSPPTTPTPSPIMQTTGDVTVHLEGIDQGNYANDQNIIPTKESQGSSKTRTLTLYFYASTAHPETDNPRFVASDTVTQITDNTSQLFGNFRQPNFRLPGITNGLYIVLAKIQEGSLIEYVTGSAVPIQIYNQGGNNILVNVDTVDLTAKNLTDQPPTTPPTMRMGNIVTTCTNTDCNFNKVDGLDYSALVDCYGNKISSDACKAHNYPGVNSSGTQDPNMFNKKDYFLADLNGDGVIDGVDYTILLKNYGNSGANVNIASTTIRASIPIQPTPIQAPQQTPTPTIALHVTSTITPTP